MEYQDVIKLGAEIFDDSKNGGKLAMMYTSEQKKKPEAHTDTNLKLVTSTQKTLVDGANNPYTKLSSIIDPAHIIYSPSEKCT